MRLVIVTGMSGAGRSTALKMLEDVGYYCVDNLPIPLIEQFVRYSDEKRSERMQRTALGIDIRSGDTLEGLEAMLDHMKEAPFNTEILYLDARDDVLIRRFKETRRSHPLSGDGRVDIGIRAEREKTAFLKRRADYILDTSSLYTRDLRRELSRIFVQNMNFRSMMITVLSFGFKYGIPADADLVFDVRFLPNPYYVDALRSQTGNDRAVRDYVMASTEAETFLKKVTDLVRFLIPNYILTGKHRLLIAVGCTGGKHRSVTLANALYDYLSGDESYGLKIEHRDIGKDAVTKRM